MSSTHQPLLGPIRAFLRPYTDNAVAARDFRVQMRGTRSVVLFGAYLLVLIGIASTVYNGIAGKAISVREAQTQLTDFYTSLMSILGLTVTLVAPSLTATAIVMERQRKSLDLVFTAPISPKYYMIGKLISTYRYVLMLLVLSIPVTASCVVLGGASWSDVLISYFLLSLDALVLTSLALVVSSVAKKPVAAVIWTYVATSAFLLCTLPYRAIEAATGGVPFPILLNPLVSTLHVGDSTVVGGWHIPDWILVAALAALIVRTAMLGASSALSGSGARETRAFRVSCLALVLALAIINGFALFGLGLPHAGSMAPGFLPTLWCLAVSSALLPFALLTPFVASYGSDVERRYRDDGWFSLGAAIGGTPSGSLTFMLAVGLAAVGGVTLIAAIYDFRAFYPSYCAWLIGAMLMAWGGARFTSSFNMGLRLARTLHFLLLLIVFVGPSAYAVALSVGVEDPIRMAQIWRRTTLDGSTHAGEFPVDACKFGAGMAAVGILLATLGDGVIERRRKSSNASVGGLSKQTEP